MKHLVSLSCLLAVSMVHAQSDDAKASIRWLTALQSPNGAFVPAGVKKPMPSLRVTSAAVRALHYLGAEVPKKADCIKFVDSCFDAKSGGFADTPGGKPDVFVTSVGIMAVAALKMPTEKYESALVKYLAENCKSFEDVRIAVAGLESIGKPSPRAKEWLAQVRDMQNPDGAFGKGLGQARATGGAAVAILRLGGKIENRDKVVKAIKDGQRLSGGFGDGSSELATDLETTYRVMRAFVMLKETPPDPEGVASFVLKCRNADGGYCVVPGQPSSVPATYYAAIIRHWLKKR